MLGIFIGSIISFNIINPVSSILLGGVGIKSMEFVIPVWYVVSIAIAINIISALISSIMALKIRKISISDIQTD